MTKNALCSTIKACRQKILADIVSHNKHTISPPQRLDQLLDSRLYRGIQGTVNMPQLEMFTILKMLLQHNKAESLFQSTS
jgi:hypothetical protein